MRPVEYKNTLILGIGHRARQGKDAATRFIEESFPGKVRRFAFADPLRMHCRLTRGMTTKDPLVLQEEGMKMRDQHGEDVWVNQVAWQLYDWDLDSSGPQLAVVSDVRMLNEANWIRSLGGILLRVIRLQEDGNQYIDPSRPANHRSEAELEDFDWDITFVVPHNGLDQLRLAARHAARQILEGELKLVA